MHGCYNLEVALFCLCVCLTGFTQTLPRMSSRSFAPRNCSLLPSWGRRSPIFEGSWGWIPPMLSVWVGLLGCLCHGSAQILGNVTGIGMRVRCSLLIPQQMHWDVSWAWVFSVALRWIFIDRNLQSRVTACSWLRQRGPLPMLDPLP